MLTRSLLMLIPIRLATYSPPEALAVYAGRASVTYIVETMSNRFRLVMIMTMMISRRMWSLRPYRSVHSQKVWQDTGVGLYGSGFFLLRAFNVQIEQHVYLRRLELAL